MPPQLVSNVVIVVVIPGDPSKNIFNIYLPRASYETRIAKLAVPFVLILFSLL
jgi:hypothetical protein